MKEHENVYPSSRGNKRRSRIAVYPRGLPGPCSSGELLGLSGGDVAKELGAMWNDAAAEDKQHDAKEAAKPKGNDGKGIAAD